VRGFFVFQGFVAWYYGCTSMKFFSYKKILAGLLLVFILPQGVYAQELALPDPGYTPESPWYRFELLWDNMRSVFTSGHQKRTKLFLEIALERLAEARTLTGRNIEGTEWATNLYRDEMTRAHREAQKSYDAALLTLLARAVYDHMLALDRISERTPFDRKLFAVRAKEYAIADQSDTLRVLLDTEPKDALVIWRESITARLKRIVAVAGDEENVVETLREYEKYALFGIKLAQAKERITIEGGAVADYVRQATRTHEAVLQGLRKKIKPLIVEQYVRSINAVRALQGLPQLQRLEEVPEDMPPIDVPADENLDSLLDGAGGEEVIPDESLPGSMPDTPLPPVS